ncbi:MAG TPA: SDR family NAD(P)-dependent oxidoreductase [Stellaceae bacterium]|nr:SDR family NAD(P)-dependent oxidoreductase [Stellaceae bacterium]
MTDATSLAGRVAVVTGASRGSGRAIALELARRGADVAVAARSRPELETLAGEIEAIGRRALVAETDLQDADAAAALPGRVEAALGRLDILVNNAGGAGAYVEGGSAGLLDTTLAAWDGVMQLNLRGPVIAAQAAARLMVKRRSGVILNITSVHGIFPRHSYHAYSAAKVALNALTAMWAVELGEYGIRVNAIAPGIIEAGRNGARLLTSPAARAEREAMIPLGRLGVPNEMAQLAAFLVSDAAAYISGAVIPAAGGWRGESEKVARRG